MVVNLEGWIVREGAVLVTDDMLKPPSSEHGRFMRADPYLKLGAESLDMEEVVTIKAVATGLT
jgi:hypothetical protein